MVCSRCFRTTERVLFFLRGDGLVLDALPVGGSLETCVAERLGRPHRRYPSWGDATIRKPGLRVLRVVLDQQRRQVLESR